MEPTMVLSRSPELPSPPAMKLGPSPPTDSSRSSPAYKRLLDCTGFPVSFPTTETRRPESLLSVHTTEASASKARCRLSYKVLASPNFSSWKHFLLHISSSALGSLHCQTTLFLYIQQVVSSTYKILLQDSSPAVGHSTLPDDRLLRVQNIVSKTPFALLVLCTLPDYCLIYTQKIVFSDTNPRLKVSFRATGPLHTA
ncbi:hypothetical protein S40288_10988 [Stachybotrys chartarum IBT 40288]|nr:hypothetical protein S40288_10988 [Stachybotrys chartarum IBT 40288]